jgi:excinuclease ABC subunit C
MVPRIDRVEAVACDSEHEAAWLERNLHECARPHRNRSCGGQEVAVYIRLDQRAGSPGLELAPAALPSAGVRHFGPYLGGNRVRFAGVANAIGVGHRASNPELDWPST